MRLTDQTIPSLVFSKITFMGTHAVPFTAGKLEREGEAAVTAVWEKLMTLPLKPMPEPQPYKDEEWSITWSANESRSRFTLDLQKELVGAQFRQTPWDQPKQIIALFAKESFRALGGRRARTMACQHEVQFLLPLDLDNRQLVAEKIVPCWDKSCLSAWTPNPAKLGRFDVKLALDVPKNYDAFVSLEFPGNEGYRTVWTEFTVKLNGHADQNDHLIDGLLAATDQVYSKHFGQLLSSLFADLEVDYLLPTRE